MKGGLAFLTGFLIALYTALACGAVYRDTAMVETNWIGQVSHVEGGKTSKTLPDLTPGGGILDTLWSYAWLLALLLVLLYVARRFFPGVFSALTLRPLRDKMAARRRLS